MSEFDLLASQWEDAYRAYTAAEDANRYAGAVDPEKVARLAVSCREVASVWRNLAALPKTDWWAKAAALHAADMFEHHAAATETRTLGWQEGR
ncbi:hypothetical protein ACFWNN_43320 [Lentzea sp. NPDC058450]|uniref:hypothetical protein n=1 Tax=Lentzea sp. NPDC058450 TaxID=3346505 RepID=UPI003664BB35